MQNNFNEEISVDELKEALITTQNFLKEKRTGSLEIRPGKFGTSYRLSILNHERKCTEKINISYDEAKIYATYRYYKQLMPVLRTEIKQFNKGKIIDNKKICGVYSKLPEEIKKLVHPLFQDKDTFIKTWINSPVRKNPYKTENLVFSTEGGDFVRSKDEQLIANTLYSYSSDFMYKYENKLVLPIDSHEIYPDFEIISLATGNIYYLEHFGMLDIDEYFAYSFIGRIRRYIRNEIYPRRSIAYDIFR